MRAPEKRVFKIDIGNIPPAEVDGYMEKLVSRMKKVPYLDERTGDYNLRFNLMNMVEDFYLPVRGSDSGTSIDTLAGMEFTGTEDIEYLRNKLMSALKIPKAFLGYDEAMGGKSTLAQEDVRFAKTIGRLQRIIVSELAKIAAVHLYVQGFEDASISNFNLELTNPSSILEQEKISIWSDKMDLAVKMDESKLISHELIYKNIFKFSAAEIERIQENVIGDMKQLFRKNEIEEKGNDPISSNQKIDSEGSPQDIGGDDSGLNEIQKKTKGRVIPDQTGIKDASDYPFGENPLGKPEDVGSRTDPIRHEFRGKFTTLSEKEDSKPRVALNKKDLSRIKEKFKPKNRKLILESLVSDDSEILGEIQPDGNSMLDEKNIIE
jgi:hypothetical protein